MTGPPAGEHDGPRRLHTLGDGRVVSWRLFGDPSGAPVLALHGTPGSALKFSVADTEARRHGLALVAPDRWGYAASQTPADPRLSLYAADAADLMAGLGHVRFAVLGVSGGGPFAAAVAAMLPNRVTAAALVAPVGEIASLTIGRDGLGLFHAFCFRGLATAPGAVHRIFSGFDGLLTVAPRLAIRLATARAGASDRKIMGRRHAALHLAAAFRDGLRTRARGPAIDLTLFQRAWDVDPRAIQCATRVWIGTADRHVPQAAARRLAGRIPHATLAILPAAGHYWIVDNIDEVMAWLASPSATHTPSGAPTSEPSGRSAATERTDPAEQ